MRVLIRRERPADRVRLAVQQRLAAEFVAQDLIRVLRQAVGEFLEGLVEAGLEGFFVVSAAGAGLREVEVVVDACGSGDGSWFGGGEGFVVGVEVVHWVGGWEGGSWWPWCGRFGGLSRLCGYWRGYARFGGKGFWEFAGSGGGRGNF